MPRSTEGGIDVVSVPHGGLQEIFATVRPRPGEGLASLKRWTRQVLERESCELLETRVFGATGLYPRIKRELRDSSRNEGWPFVFVQGGCCGGGEIAGVQLHAVVGPGISSWYGDGRPIARSFEDRFARYCILGDLHSPDPSRTRARQARETIEQLMAGLGSAGMEIRDLVRTWFFVDEILEWYPDFNRVRSEIYSAEGVFDRFLPASTGIGGRNPQGAAVTASAIAVAPKHQDVRIRKVASPLQCPAFDYGSSFSRAAELETPDHRSLFVSGTASIDSDGKTAHRGDLDAQIAHTLDVVAAILDSRDMGFSDVVRGNAYFKDATEGMRLERHAQRRGVPMARMIISQNHVCRDDLLFEMEVQAVKVKERV